VGCHCVRRGGGDDLEDEGGLNGMITRIIKHELRILRADRTLWTIIPLFAMLIAYGVYNGASWTQFQKTTLEAAKQEENNRFAKAQAEIGMIEQGGQPESPFRDPRLASVAAGRAGTRYATLPPAPLAGLSVGQSDLYPYYFKVTSQSKQNFVANDEIENPGNLLAGRFDLAFVIIYLYPLLILALSYNLISSEREQGTLALKMSMPLRLRTFVIAKAALLAMIALALAGALSVVGFLLSGASVREEGTMARLAMWIAVVAGYGTFWFALAIAINAFGKSSATNAMALAGVWLLFALLAPSLLNAAVTTVYPVPSRVEMVQAMRRASAEASTKGSQLLAKYIEDHPELSASGRADPNDFYTRSIAVQSETERLIQPVMDRFDQQVLGQQTLVKRFRFLSPAIAAQAALNDIAGTGAARYRSFLDQVDRFHQDWRAYFNPRIVQKASLRASDYEQFPRFVFQEEPPGVIVTRALIGFSGIAIPAILIGWLALRSLRRYPLANS
jgi:ABC-2 type transport system permease protein